MTSHRHFSSLMLMLSTATLCVALSMAITASATPNNLEAHEIWNPAFSTAFLEVEVDTAQSEAQTQTQQGPPPRDIKGRIRLNGVNYKTSCSCGDPKGVCENPLSLRVHQEPFNLHRGLDKLALRNLLGPASAFQLVDAAHTSFACIDGRETRNVLATLGGDSGELLTAMSIYEDLANKNLTMKEIKDIFVSYLSNRDFPLYFCTDETAVAHIAKHLRVGGSVGVVGINVDDPPEEFKAALVDDLVKVENQGDYFLKALLSDAVRFYIRKELVEDYIRVIYQLVWDKKTLGLDGAILSSKIAFNIYDGTPREKAFISFRSSSRCESANLAPAFAPSFGNYSVFVNHPVAVSSLRADLGKFFSRQSDLKSVSQEDFLARLQRRGQVNLEEAVHMFAANVPFYTVNVE